MTQHKRNVLGKFASRNLQKDFEKAVPKVQKETITYDDMVLQLKTHNDWGRSKTLSNYEFHKLAQEEGDSFDNFVIAVKREAAHCDFKCTVNWGNFGRI